MALFDEPNFPDWLQDKFPEGTAFKMDGIRIFGTVPPPADKPNEPRRNVVLVTVGGVEYACTGVGFEQQANQLEEGDLPAFVTIGRKDLGNGKAVKRFMPAR